jgi:VCBS repeat-containing protein
MATVDKDFKVKNGLVVANGGTFGGTVTVATPTLGDHATTKDYVDDLVGGAVSVPVLSEAPDNPEQGTLYIDTITKRLHMYLDSSWSAIATLQDAETLRDHIHDTSIDGSGLIVSIFVSGGTYNEAGALVEAGVYNTVLWSQTWDGGISIDNFN